jgi:hypothetical protein
MMVDAFRFRELIVLRCDEFTRFASRARAVTTEQIHTVGVVLNVPRYKTANLLYVYINRIL